MAYSETQWQQARGYYEAGLTLSKIKEKTGIARNTVSKRAKKEQWEHGANTEYVEAREIVNSQKGTILQEKGTVFLNALDEIADDNIRRKELVFGGMENLVKRTNQLIESNQVVDKVNAGMGVQNFEPRPLVMSDMKLASETLTNIGKAFGVIDDKPQVAIQNNNNQENSVDIVGYGVKTIESK